jgi:uroporphyrinogen-III decarboxylase
MGVTATVYALADEPSLVERAVEAMAATDDPYYEIAGRSKAPVAYIGENLTSEVVSPALFDRFYAPYYRRRSDQLHEAGKPVYVHIDGTLRGLLPRLAATGIDCAQSLTPAPVGDVAIEDLRGVAGPGIILWGGVPGVYFSPQYPEHQLRESVRRCLVNYRDDGAFMLCVADQVPPDADIDRVRRVSELVEQEGALAP